jgi:hypothetical protein
MTVPAKSAVDGQFVPNGQATGCSAQGATPSYMASMNLVVV